MPDSVDEAQEQEHEEEVPACPVCARHSDIEAMASQQVIFLGAQAMLDRDDQMVEDIFANLSAYDAHVAISLLMMALGDISGMTGIPVRAMVDKYRENLSSAQLQAEA